MLQSILFLALAASSLAAGPTKRQIADEAALEAQDMKLLAFDYSVSDHAGFIQWSPSGTGSDWTTTYNESTGTVPAYPAAGSNGGGPRNFSALVGKGVSAHWTGDGMGSDKQAGTRGAGFYLSFTGTQMWILGHMESWAAGSSAPGLLIDNFADGSNITSMAAPQGDRLADSGPLDFSRYGVTFKSNVGGRNWNVTRLKFVTAMLTHAATWADVTAYKDNAIVSAGETEDDAVQLRPNSRWVITREGGSPGYPIAPLANVANEDNDQYIASQAYVTQTKATFEIPIPANTSFLEVRGLVTPVGGPYTVEIISLGSAPHGPIIQGNTYSPMIDDSIFAFTPLDPSAMWSLKMVGNDNPEGFPIQSVTYYSSFAQSQNIQWPVWDDKNGDGVSDGSSNEVANTKKPVNKGAIIGGVIGGVAALAILAMIGLHHYNKKKRLAKRRRRTMSTDATFTPDDDPERPHTPPGQTRYGFGLKSPLGSPTSPKSPKGMVQQIPLSPLGGKKKSISSADGVGVGRGAADPVAPQSHPWHTLGDDEDEEPARPAAAKPHDWSRRV